jgi:HD-GYP domain-containing protein (c-di-GMP phosphodiesterase class II)
LIGLLALAFVLVVAYGQEIATVDYSEPLLLIGLLAFLTCGVAYFADKERESRAENGKLIQELHETAQALDARVARLNKLCETSADLAGALDINRISELVVEALVGQVHADAASLVLMDKSKGQCLHARSAGPLAEANAEPEQREATATAAAEEVGHATRRLNQPEDVARQLEAWSKMRTSISAPVKVSEVVSGALAAIGPDSFSTEDLNLLTTLANMASKAIESAELHQQLRQSYFRTLHVLSHTLAARDPYSGAHGEAVAWLGCRLGERLGLGDEVIEALRAYGPLHDLGKIGIPDSVLLKAGSLTDEELEMCRQHTVIGEEIIRPLNPGPAVLSMIRNHHERWDGGGYPDGLSGEQIPVPARIVAVADAFHAIASHRPYRPGAILFTALREIRRLAGAQFDPTVVRALVDLWNTGELAKFTMRGAQPGETAEIVSRSLLLVAPPSFVEWS